MPAPIPPDTEAVAPPRTELQELQYKAGQVTDESLESTRRMLALCEESEEAGTKTLEMLNEQGESSGRSEDDSHAGRARRSSNFKEDEGTWKGNDDGKIVSNQPQRVMDGRNGLGPASGYIAKITNDARETEMEDNISQVTTMVGNLKNMALDMGSELENQNRQIDSINRKADSNQSRIASANQRAHDLLK